ncbi:MAG: hypothetical protein MJZ41_16015 [Bacteroidaceae bacterium]|nr:hypothetical protein [Bacteroidaceae bacterium]
MKCELIIEGLKDKQQFYNCCLQSYECKCWHDGSSQPIGISEFELEKLYPTKVEGMIPTLKNLKRN